MRIIRESSNSWNAVLTSWLGSCAVGLGFGAALACGCGIANADTTPGNHRGGATGDGPPSSQDRSLSAPTAAADGPRSRGSTGRSTRLPRSEVVGAPAATTRRGSATLSAPAVNARPTLPGPAGAVTHTVAPPSTAVGRGIDVPVSAQPVAPVVVPSPAVADPVVAAPAAVVSVHGGSATSAPAVVSVKPPGAVATAAPAASAVRTGGLDGFRTLPAGPVLPVGVPIPELAWAIFRRTDSRDGVLPAAATRLASAAAVSTPSLSIADASIAEGNSGTSNMAFKVTLSSAATSKVTVRYATASGTASSSSDYTSTSGTLTFAPGVTSQTITVKVAGNTTVEPDETFTVKLSRASGATLARATATGTILNDDSALPTVSIADASLTEGNSGTSNMAFTVSLSNASASTVSVGYATAGATATAGQDYNTASGTITFAPGVTSQVVNVGVIGDTSVESDETFTVKLSTPSGATLARTTATGTIRTDDVASQPGGPAVPFGSHLRPYAAGTILPSISQATMDAAVVALYTKWKSNFVVSAGSYGLAVKSTDADYPYVAEAQGYGLEITALMAGADPAAQSTFDGILKYVLTHPSSINSGLLAAEQNSSFASVNGKDSATDGDLAVAYGLLLADKQWGSTGTYNYKQLAISRINAIKAGEMDPVTKLPTLGDWNTPGDSLYNSTRPSDFMIDHFRAFKAATGDPFWDSAVTAAQTLVTQQQNSYAPSTGLIADFVVNTNTTPKPAPANFLEGSTDGQYSYNAVRVPWHLGADAAVYGDATSKAQIQKMTAWFQTKTGGDPSKIVSGYKLDGTAVVSYLDPEFVAVLGPAAMGNSANQAWLDKIWNYTAAQSQGSAANTYYGASLMLQSMIVMSGNYWTP